MFYCNKIQTKKKTNLWYIKIKFVVFYYKIPTTLLLQNHVSKNPHPSSQNFPFWAIPNHITMIQKQQEFKIRAHNIP